MSEQVLSASEDLTQDTSTPIEKKPLTREQLFELKKLKKLELKNQIEDLKLPVELIELRCRLSKATYDNYRYSIELNKLQTEDKELQANQIPEGSVEHIITQEDLDKNPSMAEQGVVLGQVVWIPADQAKNFEDSKIETPVVDIKTDIDTEQSA